MKGYVRHRSGALVHEGAGPVVLFQHGLCGDAGQPAEVFPAGAGFRHAVLNCRGHGGAALGSVADLSIATFASDVGQVAAALRPVAVGGISMGAAIALRLAVTAPALVPALILVRPAWVVQDAPANMAPNAEAGRLLPLGLAAFDASPVAQMLARVAPDNLASLRGFFARHPLDATGALLTAIAADGPGVTEADLATLRMPVLVLASAQDFIHPLDHARRLAALIPGATFVQVPPKGLDRAAHVAATQTSILSFLKGLTNAPSER